MRDFKVRVGRWSIHTTELCDGKVERAIIYHEDDRNISIKVPDEQYVDLREAMIRSRLGLGGTPL